MNWCHILDRYTVEHPDKEAIVFEGQRITYRELHRRVSALARGLLDLGLARGDRLAIITDNCPEFIETTFAVNKTGAVWLPLNWRLVPEELLYMLNDSGAKMIVASPQFCEAIDSIRSRAPSLKQYICLGAQAGWQSYYELQKKNDGATVPTVEAEMEDLNRLMYTSGTTAHPKGVMVSNANLYWKCVSHIIVWNLRWEVERALVALPLFHSAGYDLPASSVFYLGGTILLLRRFDAVEVLKTLQNEKATCLCFTPSVINMLLSEPTFDNYDVSSLQLLIDGGEKIPRPLAETVTRKFPHWFANSYGMTETVTGDTFIPRERAMEKLDSVGIPMPQMRIRVVDDNDQDVPVGANGEIVLRGPKLCKGYWNKPEITAEAFRNGWFHTGDIGRFDPEGYLYIVDRKKDMIKSGGENIAAAEVEAIIYQLPQVKEVAVIGIPHPKWGETPKAFVICKPGQSLDPQKIVDHCQQKLAKFKVPKDVEFVSDFPRTSLGKILKRELRAQQK